MEGILNINKPAGITSFQAVSRVRRIAGGVKTGHAGTLDPFATGVLPILLGKASRVAEYFLDYPKTYQAQITLGVETNTLDITGEVVDTAETGHIKLEDVQAVMPLFTGEVSQTPPVYSAIKQGGKRMYQMARDGLKPEPVSRIVNIQEIKITSLQLPLLAIEVTCGRGTYIRSLARDIGLALNSRGHLSQLERSAYGPLKIADSLHLDDIEKPARADVMSSSLQSLDTVLKHLPAVELKAGEGVLVANGGSIYRCNLPDSNEDLRAYDENGALIALMTQGQSAGWYKPRKVFARVSQP